MDGRKMARLMARRSKRKSPRRTQTNISLTGVAQSYIVGSAMTKAITGNSLADFVTGRGGNSPGQFKPGADHGGAFSLPELLGVRLKSDGTPTLKLDNFLSQGHFGGYTLTSAVKENLMNNGFQAAVTAIAVPVGFRVIRRLSSRAGVTRYVNKAFKMTGLPVRM